MLLWEVSVRWGGDDGGGGGVMRCVCVHVYLYNSNMGERCVTGVPRCVDMMIIMKLWGN